MQALEMVEHIRNAFTDHVWELPWMDDKTKRTAVEKAHAMRTFIGYPDWLIITAELEQYYRQASPRGNVFSHHVVCWWVMPASTVNAFYSPLMNSMTFPAGILQPPFYNLGLISLNYGAIGSIMGHELTHGFDDQGRRFDKHGNMRQWWTGNTLQEYKNRVRCFVEQYSRYKIPELGDKLFVSIHFLHIHIQYRNVGTNAC
ncbi:hypothetical protein PR048_032558 [Dryococelus australis]|uniref:Uncharacterized protein n=1 Tax=Dryococelus australis TaxID=614101 RepID=A0ABQ9G5I1_9NEOP|nr:hypothetical protein PR048_032558 [Dryococelus australis]